MRAWNLPPWVRAAYPVTVDNHGVGVLVGEKEGFAVDRVALRGIRARGYHGVLPRERVDGQDFVVDLTLGLDTRPAAASDDLSLTVYYGAVAQEVVDIVTGEPVNLIETLAEQIAKACLKHEAVDEAKVTVHKPGAPIVVPFDDVTVTVVRRRG